jgi:hypothetical protein
VEHSSLLKHHYRQVNQAKKQLKKFYTYFLKKKSITNINNKLIIKVTSKTANSIKNSSEIVLLFICCSLPQCIVVPKTLSSMQG